MTTADEHIENARAYLFLDLPDEARAELDKLTDDEDRFRAEVLLLGYEIQDRLKSLPERRSSCDHARRWPASS